MKTVEIVLPVHNEAGELAERVATLMRWLGSHRPRWEWRVTIAENGSTDRTREVAADCVRSFPRTSLWTTDRPGRGGALRGAWAASDADVLAYMDLDLSTDLSDAVLVIEAVTDGTADLAVASRLLRPEWVERGLKRTIIGRCYAWLARAVLNTKTRDFQCGCKVVSRAGWSQLRRYCTDTGWFFDTQLVCWAERLNWRVLEIPVHWRDDPDSRVNILRTAIADLRGLHALAKATSQL